jgi:hypothetical protein
MVDRTPDPFAPFCSAFDAALADAGPPALFLEDPEGRLRFDPEWTRDAWGRTPAVRPGRCWALARDADSGYVQIVLSTSPDLVLHHPRATFRAFDAEAPARAALAALGRPPIAREPW